MSCLAQLGFSARTGDDHQTTYEDHFPLSPVNWHKRQISYQEHAGTAISYRFQRGTLHAVPTRLLPGMAIFGDIVAFDSPSLKQLLGLGAPIVYISGVMASSRTLSLH